MFPEPTSTVYDLGQHVLEVTAGQTFLLTAHPTDQGPVSEQVELDHEEAYKLLITLQTMFPSTAQ